MPFLETELPEVVQVIPNTLYEMTTTRTWDYLGVSPGNSDSLLQKANMGYNVIVGVIDSGMCISKICLILFKT